MNKFRVHIEPQLWSLMKAQFEAAAPLEDGGFYLARLEDTDLTLEREVPATNVKWDFQEERALKPSSVYLNRAAAHSVREQRVVVFVHTHPMGWARFSDADEWAHEAWAPFFQKNGPTGAFGSLVWGMEAWFASLWTAQGRLNCTQVEVL